MKLVALCVPAKIIVIFQNQDLGTTARFFAVEMRRCKPADPAAHDREVVSVRELSRRSGILPKRPIAQAVCDFKRTCVASSQAGRNGRTVAGPVLWLVAGSNGR